MENTIKIRGARENNLKNINLDIPRDKLVIMTGVSDPEKPAWPLTQSMPKDSGGTWNHSQPMPGSFWAILKNPMWIR